MNYLLYREHILLYMIKMIFYKLIGATLLMKVRFLFRENWQIHE